MTFLDHHLSVRYYGDGNDPLKAESQSCVFEYFLNYQFH